MMVKLLGKLTMLSSKENESFKKPIRLCKGDLFTSKV